MASASSRRPRHQDAPAGRPGPATTADRLIGSAQALEKAARSLKARATQLRTYGPVLGCVVNDLDWGKSDIHTAYRAALSALEGEGGS